MNKWPYNTQNWRTLRDRKLTRSKNRCEECGRETGPFHVHHIRPITEDQRKAKVMVAAFPGLDGLAVLCASCHSMITRGIDGKERKRRIMWRSFIETTKGWIDADIR